MTRRVEDEGRSECRSVMEQIGVEPSGKITSRESGPTSLGSFFTKESGKPTRETRQMTADSSVGAVSGAEVNWHAIDWQKVHRNVRRLQVRIVKAVKEGRWGRVKALQHLLTHSFSGKALAVRRVTENQGKRTPGVDGVVWDTPEKKAEATGSLRQRGYSTRPLRRVYIPKSHGRGCRPLSIPCMTDRAMQALYLLALDPIAETTADPNSYGFRSERSPADAIERTHHVLTRMNAAKWILDADIRSCFDKISHEWLEAHIPMEKSILRKWLRAGFMDKRVLFPIEEGVPQGGVVSPALMNLTLDGLERLLMKRFPPTRWRDRQRVNFVRFADDLLVTGRSREQLEDEVTPVVERFLAERGLELSVEKTRIVHVSEGFDFLGQHVRKYGNGKVLTRPSKKSVKALLDRVRAILKVGASLTTGQVIVQLNPVLRGWANYHRHAASKQTFGKLNHIIFRILWRWAKRRHPHKPAHWVRAKYFRTRGNRNWVFSGTVEGRDGEVQDVWLYDIALTPVCRHVKIRGEANPYDPEWEEYFEHRLGVRMAQNLKGRRTLLYLWRQQDGLCPVCDQKITRLTGWHAHHIVRRSDGGSDGIENRVLLHPECHRKVHSQGTTVSKPRPATGV
jgi:RNA-directed DNA polymerase